MAWASVGSLGTANSKVADQSSLVLTTIAALEAGNVGIIVIAVDNNATVDGDEGAVTGVVDSAGNTWLKAAELTQANGAAQDGTVCSLWYVRAGTTLASGGTITASFNNATSRDASAASAWEFTIGAGATVSIEGTPATVVNTGSTFGSLNVTTPNAEFLRFRAISLELSNVVMSTATSGWTLTTNDNSSGGSGLTNQAARAEFHISTGTGDASQPSSAVSGDRASIYVAFKEAVSAVSLSPAQADLALSPTAPARVADVRRDPARVDLALSPTAPTAVATVHTALAPARVDLALSSVAPTVAQTTTASLVPATRDLVLSPTAPTAARTEHVGLVPARVDLALSSVAASAVQDVRRDPPRVDLVLSPTAPSRDATAHIPLAPAARDLALSPTAPTVAISAHVSLSPPRVDLVLTPTVATAALSDNVLRAPGARDLALSTTAATLTATANVSLSPSARDLALSFVAPAVAQTAHISLSPSRADLALSPTAATLVQTAHVSLSPAACDLALSPVAPAVAAPAHISLVPASGNIVLSGIAPSVVAPAHVSLNPARADLSVSSVAPSVAATTNTFISPARRDLLLSSVAPAVLTQILLSPARADLVLSTAASVVSGGVWYVDNAVGVSGNGKSWSTAWQQFSDIVWADVLAGDTVFISGGSTSKTYDIEGLVVGKSGTAGHAILITKGVDAGHNGEVIIDGDNGAAASIGIDTNGHNHLVVRGFSVRNIDDCCIFVDSATAGVIVEENTCLASGPGGGNARGIDVRHCSGAGAAIVRNNIVGTHTNTTDQTDCLYLQDNADGSVEAYGNRFIQSNIDTTGHSDCIQTYDCGSLSIHGNYCEQLNGGADNHGIFVQDVRTGSVCEVYNNIVVMRGATTTSAVTHENEPTWTGKAVFENNTIHGGSRAINLVNTPAADEAKNNIIFPAAGGIGFFIDSATPPSAANVNNNLIYAPSATIADVNSVSKNWFQWQALGYDANGVNADPQLVNAATGDFRLLATSPAIDAGSTLAGVTSDFNGVVRPKNAGYDIGALESWHLSRAPARVDLALSAAAPALTITAGVALQPARRDLVLSGTASSLVLTGIASLQPRSGQIQLNSWILDENGDPVLDENDEPIIDEGPNAPIVAQTFGVSLQPGQANLALTTVAPQTAVTISPAAASLQIDSAAPSLIVGGSVSLVPNFVDLVLTSFAPLVVGAFRFEIPTANLRLTGIPPKLSQNIKLAPQFGDLKLSAAAPIWAIAGRRRIRTQIRGLPPIVTRSNYQVASRRNIPTDGSRISNFPHAVRENNQSSHIRRVDRWR